MEISTRIPVPGTYNFRDVGGLPAREGVVRRGVLYRSDGLHRLGDDGREALRRLGVGMVIDLRDENEARMMPDDLVGLRHPHHKPRICIPAAEIPIQNETACETVSSCGP